MSEAPREETVAPAPGLFAVRVQSPSGEWFRVELSCEVPGSALFAIEEVSGNEPLIGPPTHGYVTWDDETAMAVWQHVRDGIGGARLPKAAPSGDDDLTTVSSERWHHLAVRLVHALTPPTRRSNAA